MVTTYGYDANGNRIQSVDPMGRKTTTAFDALDRARDVSIANADGSLPQGRRGYTMGYDPEANLTSVIERVGMGASTVSRNYARTYDTRNRLASATDPLGHSVGYVYDATNNLTTFTDAANRQTGYSYDAMNRLNIATLPGGRAVDYDWTVDGLLDRVAYGNGMSRAYTYDNADRVTSITNKLSASDTEGFAYTYDANSNRDTEIRQFNGSTTRAITYGYDALNRLTQAAYGGTSTVNWSYDKLGNRLTETGREVGGASLDRSLVYDDLNRLSSVTDNIDSSKSTTLEYDLNGNLTKERSPNGNERRFEYDSFNQMLRAASFVSSTSTETQLGSYDYDFEGRRISRTAAASTLNYVYSGINVVNEFSGSTGNVVNSYDYGADLVRADIGGEGERLYFHDALGSVTGLSSGAGSTVARYEYDAWGKQISATQPSSNRVNFTGYKHDDETGFEYALARSYDSGNGRFTSFDPVTEDSNRIMQPQGLNFYSYTGANPLVRIDPDGQYWMKRRSDGAIWYGGHPGKPSEIEIDTYAAQCGGIDNLTVLRDGFMLKANQAPWNMAQYRVLGDQWLTLGSDGRARQQTPRLDVNGPNETMTIYGRTPESYRWREVTINQVLDWYSLGIARGFFYWWKDIPAAIKAQLKALYPKDLADARRIVRELLNKLGQHILESLIPGLSAMRELEHAKTVGPYRFLFEKGQEHGTSLFFAALGGIVGKVITPVNITTIFAAEEGGATAAAASAAARAASEKRGAGRLVDEYVSGLRSKPTPSTGPADLYEIRHTGPTNYEAVGGGEKLWIDGHEGTAMLDAKYVGNPARSPYIPGSGIPDRIRTMILDQTEREVMRAGRIVADPNVPFKSLTIITNDPAAKPYFESLLKKYGVPGEVVIKE